MSTPNGGSAAPDETVTTVADEAFDPVDLWSTFKRVHEVVRARVIADTAETVGLSEPDLTILVNLDKAGGALRQSELAASLGWDRTRISHQLTRMGKRGLVARERGEGVTVRLTDSGRATVAAVHPGLDAAVRRHLTDRLTPLELATLDAVFRRL